MPTSTRLPNVRAASEDYSPAERHQTLETRLEAYTPNFIPPELWETWRPRIAALVLACEPSNDYSAVGLARAAAGVVAAEHPAEDSPWPDVLSDVAIAAQVGRLRTQADDPTVQQRLSMLRRLQKAALGLPQIPRGSGSPSSAGSPWTEAEFRNLWALSKSAPQDVAAMLRYRLAVEVVVGIGGPEAARVDFNLNGTTATAVDAAGLPLPIAPGWAAVVAELCDGVLTRPEYDHKRLRTWLKSRGVSFGRNRGRDAYLKEMWAAAESAADGLHRTRSTYSDIERLSPVLELPETGHMRDLLRGRGASNRALGDLDGISHRGTAD